MDITQGSPAKVGYNNKFLKHLNELGSRLELSEKVQEDAKDLIEPQMERLARHYDEKYLAAAALIISSRLNGNPRTIPQTCRVFKNKKGYLGQVNGQDHKGELRKHFNKIREVTNPDLGPVKPAELIDGILKIVEDDVDKPAVREEAGVIVEKVQGRVEFCDVSQTGLAASVIYLACKEQPGINLPAPNLEDASGRNEKTIRSTARKILEETEYELE